MNTELKMNDHCQVCCIIRGCSCESEFEGTRRECVEYVREQARINPHREFIIGEEW